MTASTDLPPTPAGKPAGPDFLAQLREVTAFLTRIAEQRSLLVGVPAADRHAFIEVVAEVFHPDPKARRSMVKAANRERKAAAAAKDDAVLNQTGIRELRRKPVFTTPNVYPPEPPPVAALPGQSTVLDVSPADEVRVTRGEAVVPQHCYICKQKFTTVHHFYDQMCIRCGDFNYAKRTELADLRGRTVLLTGGRVKIGYQAGLKVLRAGARLIVTTRFPRDSAQRYAAEPDFAEWADRLVVYGLDLRHTPSVEAFCQELLAHEPRLDAIINNACQTVRRPPAFYAHMMETEHAPLASLPPVVRALTERASAAGVIAPAVALAAPPAQVVGMTHAAALSQVPLLPDDALASPAQFPLGALDQDLQQVDLRDRNSWRLLMDEVSSVELMEVQLVNAIAPFIINARLKALMLRTPNRDKHIVNVSAMEGQFYRNNKTTRHPHTNMAKAALNMMTRTSAADYQQDGIHMNSVDTGWVTDEDVEEIAARKVVNHRFHPPLDIVDGAARIVDPLIDGINTGVHRWGQFLKDYVPTDW